MFSQSRRRGVSTRYRASRATLRWMSRTASCETGCAFSLCLSSRAAAPACSKKLILSRVSESLPCTQTRRPCAQPTRPARWSTLLQRDALGSTRSIGITSRFFSFAQSRTVHAQKYSGHACVNLHYELNQEPESIRFVRATRLTGSPNHRPDGQ